MILKVICSTSILLASMLELLKMAALLENEWEFQFVHQYSTRLVRESAVFSAHSKDFLLDSLMAVWKVFLLDALMASALPLLVFASLLVVSMKG